MSSALVAEWVWVQDANRLAPGSPFSAVTSRRIMAGDLSRRLEVTGTGDEFDRLANSLNAMLERIEHLLIQLVPARSIELERLHGHGHRQDAQLVCGELHTIRWRLYGARILHS